MNLLRTSLFSVVSTATLLSACTPATSSLDEDGRYDVALTEAALARLDECEVNETLSFVNNAETTAATLKEHGVHGRAANNIEATRAGIDGTLGTADDVLFGDLIAVDDVPYVGPAAMEQLLSIGAVRCEGVSTPAEPGTCAPDEVLSFLNAPSTDVDALLAIDLHSRAAREIVAHRDGADATPGTADDQLFASMHEVDAVPQVGPVAIATLEAYGASHCSAADVVFSPQDYDDSHLARVVELIDGTQHSIDIAMYSYRDGGIQDALERAVDRGVTVRFLFQSTSDHRSSPAGTRSAALEDAGIEVRWVNKIQHHKFAIFDGPRNDLESARTGILASGSGNWSHSAATRFDENMVILEGDQKLNLLFQQEFDHLWTHSRDFVWNETIAPVSHFGITDDDIANADGSTAVFTSANFRTYESSTYGPTFAKDEGSAARDALIELIEGADESVYIASGHLRSRQITDAILAKAAEGIDVRVYLDGQEYTSAWYFGQESDDYEECLADASTDTQVANCHDDGLHFGYALHQAGVPLRYKYYAYRWDYTYADQMHHKYIVIDRDTVATGSYNFSNNAEFDTFENVAILDAGLYPELVNGFVDNFDTIWNTGAGTLDAQLDELENGTDRIDIVFEPKALTYDEITTLKSAIRAACPDVDSSEYRQNASSHWTCPRG